MRNHVPDLERCKRLRDGGFRRDTSFLWMTTPGGKHWVEYRIGGNEWAYVICAAPIVTELLAEIIKIAPTGGDTLNFVDMMLTKRGDFYVGCLDGPMVHADTLLNALADLWLWLRERGE